MTRRSALLVAFSLLLLAGAALLLPFLLFLQRPVAPPSPTAVHVPPGTPFRQVAERLEAAGVVADAGHLRLLARLRGDAHLTQAGEYDFAAAATPGAVLDRLVSGDVRRLRFTFPEGLTVREIASRLELEGLATADEVLRLSKEPGFLASLQVEAASLEGYLFPETYTFDAGTPATKLLQSMVRQFRTHFSEEMVKAAKAVGLSAHQLVTLASIIQKEAGNVEEMPLISGVFHNRLRLGMPLQADPTVIYGIEGFDGNITRRHLNEYTPYNTYRIPGLPPGPIANPGREALQAAANPATVDYLFFVSRGDGTHQFSATLREHNAAVRQFQLRR
ncbi:MAG: endolytic transglycosylase MltG [Desulfuromonadales bacterium]|nr:endolytic transglycosylase MltG [Desulfuromonadales bacterium]